jgi:thiol-disulfide isomerase/thioredoxin
MAARIMTAPRPLRSFVVLTALVVASLVAPAHADDAIDLEGYLQRPGVKLVAVEFFATWCKPCMDAVPRWKALHDKYRKKGLRLVVVAHRDPQAGCVSPGWSPDEIICDDEGRILDAFGGKDALPAAYLWSWQGNLLVRGGPHVDDVEQAVEQWMLASPRLAIEASLGAGVTGTSQAVLAELVREQLITVGKLDVVASADEAAQLDALKKASLAARFDERAQCEVGKELPANSLLKVTVIGGTKSRLSLSLFSAVEGCLVAASVVDWDPERAKQAVAEAAAQLIRKLQSPVQLPRNPSAQAKLEVEEKVVSAGSGGWTDDRRKASTVLVRFESEPTGATVMIDGKVKCQATPCQKALPSGTLEVTMLRERYQEKKHRVTLEKQAQQTVRLELTPNFGFLSVESPSPGMEVLLDGQRLGVTPLERAEVDDGLHVLAVRAHCHDEWKKEGLAVRRGEQRRERAEPRLREARLSVSVVDGAGNDLAAEVLVDGRAAGRTPGEALTVSACSTSLVVVTEDGQRVTRPLSLTPWTESSVVVEVQGPANRLVESAPSAVSLAEGSEWSKWLWFGMSAAAVAAGVVVDATGTQNGQLDAVDFVPVGLYGLGAGLFVAGIF